jgi:hypothetical protein
MKSVWPPKPEWMRAEMRDALASPQRSTWRAVWIDVRSRFAATFAGEFVV